MSKGKTKAQLELELQAAQTQIAELKRQLEQGQAFPNSRSAERLDVAARSAQIGIWDWDIQKNELVWDAQMYALYGLKPGAFGGAYEAWLKGVHPEDRVSGHEISDQAIRGEQNYDTEFRVLWPDGSIHWLKANGIVFRDEAGIPLRMVGINYDITARKHTEESLRQSEQRYSALFEKSAVPAALTKMPEGIFADVNEAFHTAYGYTREDVIGKTSVEIGMARPDERTQTYINLQRFGTLRENEKHLFTKAGEARIGSVNINRIALDGQDYVITTIHDVTERKQTEVALLQSQRNFAGAFEANPAGLAITRRVDGKFLLINPAYSTIMGYSADELIGHTVAEFSIYVNPDERAQMLQQMTEQGAVHNYELAVRNRSGYQREILVSMEPVLYDQEDCILSAFIDITTRKQMEKALRDSEERFTNAFHTSPVAQSITIAETGEILEVNAAFCTMLGYPREDLLGNSTVNLHLWDQSNERLGVMEQLRTTGHVYSQPAKIRTRSNEVRTVLVSVEPIIWQGRRCALSSSIDITERQQTEERLTYQSMLLTNVSDAIIGTNSDLHITYWNKAAEVIFGWTAEEVVGKTTAEVLQAQFLNSSRAETLRGLIETGQYDGELRYIRKNGDYFDAHARSIVLKDAQENFTGLVTSIRDITERKQLEAALRDSEQRYTLLFQKSTTPVILVKLPEVIIADANEAAEKLTGYTHADMVGRNAAELGLISHTQRTATITQFEHDQTLTENEMRITTKSGAERIVIVNTNPLEIARKPFAITSMQDITERKQAEQALREQAERLREQAQLLEHAHVLLRDMDNRIVTWNTGMQQLYGWSEEEALGQVTHTFFQTQFPHSQEAYETELLQTGQWEGELIHIRKDGRKVVVAGHHALYRDAAGTPTMILEVNNDITELKTAEESLRLSEERLRLSLQAANQGLYDLNPQTGEAIVNDEYAWMLGYDPATFHETNAFWMERLHPDDQTRAAQAYSDYVAGKLPEYRVEFRQRMRTGEWKWILSMGKILEWDAQGQPLRMLGTHSDIDQRKRTEQALAASQKLLQDVIDNTSALVYIVDAEGRFLLLNHKLESLFGVETGTLIGKTRHDFMPESFATEHRNNDLEIFNTRQGKIFEEENQEADGRHVYLTTKFPLWDEQNQVYAICGISTDMTDRKLMEEELRRSNAELEQFAYVASHDLQEPLRAVAGMVHLLGQRYKGQLDERADEYIAHAVEAASRMQALISDLLAYSRVERRTKPIEPVSAETCLRAALQNLSLLIHETKAVITTDPLPKVEADASQLTQLLQNLIGNGIKFRGEHEPHVHISVTKLKEAWQFTVRDNGIGIEPEYFERIFLVFQRLHTRREYPGTGIGLAICKKIVERHGGQIWVESTPGAGSAFYFTLPIRTITNDHELTTATH